MQPRTLRRRAGFTLLEMMLVVLIMGLLATVVVISLGGKADSARIELTKTKLAQVRDELTQYQMNYGTYPPSLQALVGVGKMPKLPLDEWKSEFFYNFPGSSQTPDQPYDLLSPGKDKQIGTPDDINVWTMEAQH